MIHDSREIMCGLVEMFLRAELILYKSRDVMIETSQRMLECGQILLKTSGGASEPPEISYRSWRVATVICRRQTGFAECKTKLPRSCMRSLSA